MARTALAAALQDQAVARACHSDALAARAKCRDDYLRLPTAKNERAFKSAWRHAELCGRDVTRCAKRVAVLAEEGPI